jgi:tetratricopeptide (TPR) repeat protein
VGDRAGADRQERRPPLPPGPDLPEWADPRELDRSIRDALRGLDPRNAERVAGHLVAAGTLVDEDPEAALAHARAARDRASRVAAVREAVGVAAYHAGDYAEAAREIRAYRRMSGDNGYRAVLADCERALGRPDVALRLVSEALGGTPDAEETVELRLVEAGARRDLGEGAAARLVLEAELGGRPAPEALTGADPAKLRVASAYADLLEEEGEHDVAVEWWTAIAAADPDDIVGAVARLGIEFADVEDDEDDDAEDIADDDIADDDIADDDIADDDEAADAEDIADDEVADEPAQVVTGSDVPAEVDGPDRDAGEDTSELEDSLAAEPGNKGADFNADVEAEVAELLGEVEPPSGGGTPPR